MRVRNWLTGLSVGSLALTGMIAAGPLTGSAQQGSMPPAAQSAARSADEDDRASGPAVVGRPLLQPSINLIRAQEIAREGQTGAVVTEVGLDGEVGLLTYSVELDNGMEIDVDATSGEVLKTEQTEEDSDDGNNHGESENEEGADNDGNNHGESENEEGADNEGNENGAEQD